MNYFQIKEYSIISNGVKNRNFKIAFLFAVILLFFAALPARADEQKAIHFEVAAFDQILYDGDFLVQSCPDNASSTNLTINAWCAVEQLAANQSWNASSTWGAFGVFLNSIENYDGLDGNYWFWFSNSEPGETALNQHILQEGEKLLLTYGTGPLKISVDNLTPQINATSTISAQYFDMMNWQWSEAASSTFVINGQEIFDEDGVYELWTSTTTPYNIFAKKDGFIQSEPILITAQLPSVQIKFEVAAFDQILYDGDFTVQFCPDSEDGANFTVNAWCAVQQLATNQSWTANSTWGAFGVFLNSIENYDSSDGNYWFWFSNSEPGETALNQHVLQEGEKLLLTYGTGPLKISVDNLTPQINATSTISAQYFDMMNWQWQSAASSTFVINGEEFFSAGGTYDLFISTTTPYSILGRKVGFLDSAIVLLTGIPAPSQDETEEPSPVSSGGGGGYSQPDQNIDISRAIAFLVANQNSDGSIGSSILYSDWSALAFAAYDGDNVAGQKIKSYLLTDPNPLVGMNPVSDYARRAMALMSLNISPHDGAKTNYIKKIVDSFDGTQFGDPTIYNDDIFALFPLLKAGYRGSDQIIKKTSSFILSKQEASGGWGSVDLTAAAIQGLSLISQNPGDLEGQTSDSISSALARAKTYLQNSQADNGSFGGNTISTAWASQAIAALNEPVSSWQRHGRSPIDFMASRQKNDGGFEENIFALNTRIWTTAYVIPAALNKTWGSILKSFSKPTLEPIINNIALISPTGTSTAPESVATSTAEVSLLPKEPRPNATSSPIVENQNLSTDGIIPETPGQNIPIETAQQKIVQADKSNEKNSAEILSPRQNLSFSDKAAVSPPAQPSIIAAVSNSSGEIAKNIFVLSGIGALILGVYLGLKILFVLGFF